MVCSVLVQMNSPPYALYCPRKVELVRYLGLLEEKKVYVAVRLIQQLKHHKLVEKVRAAIPVRVTLYLYE